MIHIAYYFPPIKSVGVNRSNRLANELASFFSSYTVYTTTNRNRLPQQVLPINNSIKVVEIPTFDFRTFLSFFRKNEKVHFNANFKKKFLLIWWAKFIASFPFNLLFGQGGLIYIILTFKRIIKQIKNDPQGYVVFSVFHPYADHVIAYLVKRRLPNVLWIADFKDLHLDPVYSNYIWKPIQLWFNKKILQRANFVTTVSEGLAQNLRKFHKDIFVLPNGVSKIPVQQPCYDDKFTIGYTGAMFQDKRRPHLLLKAIQELILDGIIGKNDIRILQAGRDLAIWKALIEQFELEGVFESVGIVALTEAHEIQSKSHMNLLLTTSHEEYKGVLTSKIFEYLGAANPIIVVINGPKDEIYEEAMSGIEHVFVGYNTDALDELKHFVLSYYSLWKTKKEYPCINKESWDRRYYWPNTIQGLVEKIESVV